MYSELLNIFQGYIFIYNAVEDFLVEENGFITLAAVKPKEVHVELLHYLYSLLQNQFVSVDSFPVLAI